MANAAVTIQKIANQTQVQLQKLVNSSNELQTKYNAAEAQKSRDWQTQMSKTAHQMEVDDLKKAGLNPVLSSGGSGAQSYTTSSASATPESGAAALANLQGSQLGAISNMESARMAAAATKKAAAVSAAAVRSAAAQSAAAQMYAANMGYKGKVYGSDMSYKQNVKVAKINAQANKWIAQNKQASTPWGLFDKSANLLFKHMPTNISVSGFLSAAKKLDNKFSNNPQKYLINYQSATKNNFTLNAQGRAAVNNVLGKMNVKKTASNRNLAVKAYVFGNRNAYNTLLKRVPRTYGITTIRPGWR